MPNDGPLMLSNSSHINFQCCGDGSFMLDPNYSRKTFNYVNDEEPKTADLRSCLTAFDPDFTYSPLTLMCYVLNPNKPEKIKKIRIAFDNCSTITVVKKSLAEELDLEGPSVDLTFTGTGGGKNSFSDNKDVRLKLRDVFGLLETDEIQAVTLPKVSAGSQKINIDPAEFDYLSDIKDFTEILPQSERSFKKHGEVQLLLGLPWETFYGCKSTTVSPHGPPMPNAVHTGFGSCLSVSNYHHTYNHQNQLQDPDLTMFMRLDIIGINDFPDQNQNRTFDELLAEKIIRKFTTYDKEKREYSSVLPWKRDEKDLPIKIQETNKGVAYATAYQWLKKLLRKNPELVEPWMLSYSDMLENGFSEKVPEQDLLKTECFHYIQTFPVEQPHKETHKVRLVFAANQKMKESKKSLNEYLLQGPNNLNDLVKLVLRVRMYPWIFIMDISRMYHRFKLQKEDRDYLRFFALKKVNGQFQFESQRMSSFPFGTTSSPFVCCFLLKEHTKPFLEDPEMAEAAKQICLNTYMDDIVLGGFSEKSLLELVKKARKILEEATLPTYKYVSNSEKTLKEFPEECIAKKDKVSILGTYWSQKDDVLTFNLMKPMEAELKAEETKSEIDDGLVSQNATDTTTTSTTFTKRQVLSIVAQIFDSTGLVTPYVLIPKLILQTCWKLKLPWDEPLPSELNERFEEFMTELPKLASISIKRCLLPTPKSKLVGICAFGDASAEAYGAAVYAIAKDDIFGLRSNLIFSKSRVRPLGKRLQSLEEELSICRLELLGALIACKAAHFCKEAFKNVDDIQLKFFSDSQVTLWRLQNPYNNYKVFVANRLKTIQQLSKPSDWFYVSTAENPADLASRGEKLEELMSSSLWLNGPEFLVNPETNYENMKINSIQMTREANRLLKEETKCSTPYFNHQVFSAQTTLMSNQLDLIDPVDTKLMNEDFEMFYLRSDLKEPHKNGLLQKFQSWNKLLRVVARVQLFIKSCQKGWAVKVMKKPSKSDLIGMKIQETEKNREALNDHLLSSEQLCEAMKFLFRLSQYLSFKSEIVAVKAGEHSEEKEQPLSRKSNLYRLRPFYDKEDCLIRMHSRVPASNLIILPRNSRISELFVYHQHVLNNHVGVNGLRARIEKIAYLVGGRCEYKRILKGCVCRPPKRLYQEMSDLPIERIPLTLHSHEYLALDYLGPWYFYKNPKAKGRKCYGLIITCLVTRHVHVELVKSCSTDAFLLGLRAYVALYGTFQKCFSDNATYFKQANKEIKKLLKKVDFGLIKRRINQEFEAEFWTFNCPESPWKLAVIESCVKLVKVAMDKALQFTYRTSKTPCFFDFDNLRIVSLELANLINDRPLTVITENDSGVATEVHVSPNYLCRGRNSHGILPIQAQFQELIASSAFDVKKLYQDRKRLINFFWSEFQSGYQRNLKFTPRWLEKFDLEIPKDTFVLLREKNFKAGRLLPARVINVIRRKNGSISRFDLKTSEHKTIIQRDIRECYLTEFDFLRLKQEAQKCLLKDKSEVREEKSPLEVPISQVLQTVLSGPEKIQCPPSARSERIHPMLQF